MQARKDGNKRLDACCMKGCEDYHMRATAPQACVFSFLTGVCIQVSSSGIATLHLTTWNAYTSIHDMTSLYGDHATLSLSTDSLVTTILQMLKADIGS